MILLETGNTISVETRFINSDIKYSIEVKNMTVGVIGWTHYDNDKYRTTERDSVEVRNAIAADICATTNGIFMPSAISLTAAMGVLFEDRWKIKELM